ncbi:MAG: NfeD family protein [Gammaproteobacteria bacterium]|nr:NfeD family protein [Gammaproteobacteria bacterium]MBU1654718.1 NfeD family protein [Gammaproteobacteria bacterium]MBU1959639.1 NfeD family protein [Gammaproteobacteria bacterium]
MGLIDQLQAWHWLVLGITFIVLEVFSPGVFFLWLGIAAGLVGLVLALFPGLGWEYQMLAFAVFSVASIVLSRRYLDLYPIQTDRPRLNRRGEQYVGRTFNLDGPILNGFGKIKVDDTTWKIEGEDCESGARIKVVGVEGTVLRVEKIQ